MNIYEKDNNLILQNACDFDLVQTFECGQCFRWNKCSGGYIGVAFGRVLKITQEGEDIILHETSLDDWNRIWSHYFDMDRDYSEIKKTLSSDKIMQEAISFGGGIRILNQEPFECLISFIISASNNIPRIKKIIDSLCVNFGEKITYLGEDYYSFPTAERLSALSLEELGVIKAGFRDKYILGAAKCVKCGQLDLECLKRASLEYAKTELLKLNGVGNKVAECVLLFSLEKYSSFPIDVWIKRIMEHCYFDGEQTKDIIADFAAEKFGTLGGFAQQYLFYWARENKIGI
ncbi:MAG: DNA-3-methyladenine glycosylase 2 family protein [Clostridia bacterium]|nr:DNA-3-methyladenine glycosylase 2 family protein [Clostridia bacterium]